MLLDKVENIRLSSLSVNPDDTSGIIWNTSSSSKLWTSLGYILLIAVVAAVVVLALQKQKEKKRDGQAMEPSLGPKFDLSDAIEMTTCRDNSPTRCDETTTRGDETTTRRAEPTTGGNIDPLMLARDEGASLLPLRHTAEPWNHVTTAVY